MLMESVKEHKAASEQLHVTGPAMSKDASQRGGHTRAGTVARRRATARHQDSSASDEVNFRQMHVASTRADSEDTCSCVWIFSIRRMISSTVEFVSYNI